MLRYGGESNVPGAPGNLFAGSPGYFLPETKIQRRMQERYYQTPEGQGLRNKIDQLKQKIQDGTLRPSFGAASAPGAIGNMGGLLAQGMPVQGDTINMGPAQGDYSNMPVIPDLQGEEIQKNMLMDEFRNRAFPQSAPPFAAPEIMAQTLPPGFIGKRVS